MTNDLGAWSPLFAAIGRHRPETLARFSEAFPEFANSINGVRVYGAGNGDTGRKALLADEVADVALDAALEETREVYARVERKSRRLRQFKFAGGIVAAFAGGGTVAALLPAETPRMTAICTAIVALMGAVLNLLSTYLDEGAGGDGAIAKLREAVAGHRRTVVLLKGEVQLARLTNDNERLLKAVGELNGVLADVEFAKARLGG